MADLRSFTALDLETTGFDPAKEKIIEVAAVRFEQGLETDHFTTLVNPQKPLPPLIIRLTGIEPALLDSAPPWEEVRDRFWAFVGPGPVVAHNLSFDWGFLRHHGGTPDLERADTLELAAFLFPTLPDLRLENLKDVLSLGSEASHRSLDDTRTCARLFLRELEELEAMDLKLLERIVGFIRDDDWNTGRILKSVLDRRQRIRPSTQLEFFSASEVEADRKQKPEKEHKPPSPMPAPGAGDQWDFVEETKKAFGPQGIISRIPGCERRESQEKMAFYAASSVMEQKHILIEAPPGVGKSMAYLAPAAFWALKHSRPVGVCTYTRALQDQLMQNDLPALERVLGDELQYCSVKGRNNYVCLRKARALLEKEPIPGRERAWIFLALWLNQTQTGETDSIALWPLKQFSGLGETIEKIKSRRDECGRENCPLSGRCFVEAARAKAFESHIVVTNHALFCAEKLSLSGGGILPPMDWVVIDEAHNLEDAATEQLTRAVSRKDLEAALGDLASNALPLDAALGRDMEAVMARAGAGARNLLDQLGDMSRTLIQSVGFKPGSPFVWATILSRESRKTSAVLDQMAGLGERLAVLGAEVEKITVDPIIKNLPDRDPVRNQWERWAIRFRFLAETLRQGAADDPAWGPWLEIECPDREPVWTLKYAPIWVGAALEPLWAQSPPVVLTSATLTVRRKFDFIKERIGLFDAQEKGQMREIRLPSPFDLQRQLMILIPTDNPEPSENSKGRTDSDPFLKEISRRVIALVEAVGGGALILFNSRSDLEAAAAETEKELRDKGFEVLIQDREKPSGALAQRFRDVEDSVLFGLRSFWAGIDVPGRSLRLAVVTRLPFTFYREPIMVHRMETLKKMGRSDFRDLTLPMAVLTFNQGLGRVIRRTDDFGAVAILDARILNKNYGTVFLESLPPHREVRKPFDELLGDVREFLKT